MAEHANQPLPRLALLVAEGAAHIGEHEQLVWEAALAERATSHFPAPGAAGKRERIDAPRIAREGAVETDAEYVAAQQLHRCTAEERRTAAVHEPERVRDAKPEDDPG